MIAHISGWSQAGIDGSSSSIVSFDELGVHEL